MFVLMSSKKLEEIVGKASAKATAEAMLSSYEERVKKAFGEDGLLSKASELARQIESMQRKLTTAEEQLNKKKIELDDVKLNLARQEVEFQFLAKKKDEIQHIELERKIIELEKAKQTEIMSLQKQYFEETKAMYERMKTEFAEITKSIMDRLPNVNWQIGQQQQTDSKR